MGINEWGVVVADNDAPTREPLKGESGLHDNDVCRLVLERSRTAYEGVQLVGSLIEIYGHSFVGQIYWIVDAEEAWIVECAGHHWVAVRLEDGVAVRANQYQITTNWEEGSEDLVEYAVEKGWCKSAADFSFAECYSKEGYPYGSSLITTRIPLCTDRLTATIFTELYAARGLFLQWWLNWSPVYHPRCK
jgi:dipeptidase